MKLLLTGFDRFDALEFNPSEIFVREFAERLKLADGVSLATEVLRTEFESAGLRIQELIEQLRPDAIICLGVAIDRRVISLERVALNIIDTAMPDNAGQTHSGKPVVLDGPVAYLSTLALQVMHERIKSLDIPVEISNHAGTYVCNQVFYLARHKIEQLGLTSKCGLIHIPQISANRTKCNPPRLSVFDVLKAIECCIAVLQNEASPR